jgi:putative ABC transport system permease protein
MDGLRQDVRHAIRVLGQNRAFTVVAVSAIALGIGANTAIFSVVNNILLRPLPYSEPERLVRLMLKFPNGNAGAVSVPKFMAWTGNSQAFEYTCLYDFSGPGLNLSGGTKPEQVKGIHVSADFFPVFGGRPAVGRVFSREEDRPGGPALAVMSHGLWVRRFGGDPAMLGRAIILNGEPFTIIGVLPAAFRSYPPADLYLPLQVDPNTTNQGHYLSAAARLGPGVSLAAANSQMKVSAERFRKQYPKDIGKEESAAAVPFQESMVGDIKLSLMVLLGAVGLVLLIACANVANLLLARSTDRSREIAIRGALGAGRWRIIRQLLTESLVLALVGGVAGLVLGVWGGRGLIAMSPANLPRSAELSMASLLDWRVLLFTLAIAVVNGILFGLFPALEISRANLNSKLKESSSRQGTGRRHYARNALVVAEIAMALVLLTGAVLLIRTFASLRQVDAGFNPDRVLAFETSLAGAKYSRTEPVDLLVREAIRRIETVPGVKAAAIVPFLPLEGGFGLGFDIPGRPIPAGQNSAGGAAWMYVSDHYFRALEIPLRRGRLFNDRDTKSSPPVVIVNEAFAKKYWPKGNPVGERIEIGKGMGPEFAEGPREIVGVIGDVKEGGLGNPAPEVMYIPLPQLKDSFMALNNKIIPLSWIIKTEVDPFTLSAAVQKQVLETDSQLAVARVRALRQVVGEATSRQDFNMKLLSVFAGIALLLAAIGVYGMLSYSVRQRSQEIGIRMALGAQAGDVLRMVVRQGMMMAGAGIVLGLAGAFALSRLLTAMLYGVKPYDPATFGAVALVLAVTAMLASWIPARRATRVDPLEALRYE